MSNLNAPWTRENQIIKDSSGVTVARIPIHTSGWLNDQERKESARFHRKQIRVMMAAPEMYEGLIELRQWFSKLQDWSGVGDPPWEAMKTLLDEIE